MTLKICTCCKKLITTKNGKRLGREPLGGRDILYINCACGSTVTLVKKEVPK